MGAARKIRHGVMLVEKQVWFAQLIAQGVSNSEACRVVRINRRTGTRWRSPLPARRCTIRRCD